jgi:hypothetical protein
MVAPFRDRDATAAAFINIDTPLWAPTVSSSVLDTIDNQRAITSLPITATKKTLSTVWSDVLDVPKAQVGRESSFARQICLHRLHR